MEYNSKSEKELMFVGVLFAWLVGLIFDHSSCGQGYSWILSIEVHLSGFRETYITLKMKLWIWMNDYTRALLAIQCSNTLRNYKIPCYFL